MKKTILTIAALATTASVALAQEPPRHDRGGHGGKVVQALKASDKNGDGNVTPEEFKTFLAERGSKGFQKLDANGDGVLSPEEFAGGGQDRAEKAFQRFDANHDGVINSEDRPAKHKKSKGSPGEEMPPPPGGPEEAGD